MKKIVLFVIVLIVFQSCGILMLRKVKCREYIVDSEKFWFQGNVGSKYTLVNNKSKEEKVFTLKDKWISSIDYYFSDTGCGCENISSQLLITGNDSIWTKSRSRYIEKNDSKVKSAFIFKIGDKKWIFDKETSIVKNEVKTINGKEVEIRTYTDSWASKTNYILVVGKGIGIISVKINKDEQWERKSLKIEEITSASNYTNKKHICN